ncbi:hypothetical protein NEISICOT_01774 [Neisseria sicca ATCC 29256]|uniref:Uncharacterized protein n=1 Tax=Neisseria sicca ATCC 29256 TaxID=547045 RepID=C6M5H4_NEISI|nr:hypothetical protein NEISICOT_01774 [Neisseria sicca ATCC 29256]
MAGNRCEILAIIGFQTTFVYQLPTYAAVACPLPGLRSISLFIVD